jgi:hypothetical protein
MDPLDFTADLARFGGKTFSEEWREGFRRYESHVRSACHQLEGDVCRFALSEWRQNLQDKRCIRRGFVNIDASRLAENVIVLRVKKDGSTTPLIFSYGSVIEINWSVPENYYEFSRKYDISHVGAEFDLYAEEVRFPSFGYEHELYFLDGRRLLIKSELLSVNIDEYLQQSC